MNKGYIQVYTGHGKGKTTAAIGLAFRAAGAGLHVFFGQFLKGSETSELHAIDRFADQITVCRCGSGTFIKGKPNETDMEHSRRGFEECMAAVQSGKYNLVILDEIIVAINLKLITIEDLLKLIAHKPEAVELVLTGRNAPKEIIDAADLVTEMREIKHYFANGTSARSGIEF